MKTRSKLWKLFSVMASTLVFAGVVAPVIKTISMQHTNTLTHALKVSDSELTDFKNDSAKMLASKVYTYDKTVLGLDDTTANSDVMKQCGVYNNDYNIAYQQLQQVDQQNPGQGYMSDDSQMSMIRKNNEKFNIDPVDFDRISSSDNQALLLSQLEQQGMSASDATQSINDYMSKAVPVAKTLQLNGLESNTMYNQQVDTNYRLDNENLIGTWLTDHYSNILIPKTQDQIMTSDLASHLAVYSSDGKTGYNVGDEFTKDDIASLFNFTYDMSTGLILNTPSCDYVNASSTDTDTVLPYIQTKDLSTCAVTGGSTWSQAEVYPGYTLHCKIATQDYDTNSDYDSITINLGVSNTQLDPQNQHVDWLDTSDNLKIVIPVSTDQEKLNIGKNYYYPTMPTTTNISVGDYTKSTDEYFVCDQSQSDRSTIEDVLANAPITSDGHYNISADHPYNITSLKQFNFDGIAGPIAPTSWHTNEQFALQVVGVDDNFDGSVHNQSLECTWAIVDHGAADKSSTITITPIAWVMDDGTALPEYIWVNFNYSQHDLDSLSSALNTANTINDTNNLTNLLLNDTKGMSDPTIESQLDGVQSQTDILYDHDSVDTGLMSGILAVGTAQSILLAVIGQIWAVALLAVMLAMDATFTVFNAMKVIDDQKAKNTASTNIPLLKQTIELFNSKDRATIQNDYSILTDGTRIISDKLKAANEVNTIVNGYDKNKYADWIASIANLNKNIDYTNVINGVRDGSIIPSDKWVTLGINFGYMIVAYGISRVIEKVRLITQGAEAVLAAEDNLNTILGRMNDAVEQLNGLATTAPETFFEFIGDVVDGSEEALGLATQEIDETLANFDKLTNGCSAAEEAVANQPFVGVLPAIEIVINILFAVQFIYEALPMFSSKIPAWA